MEKTYLLKIFLTLATFLGPLSTSAVLLCPRSHVDDDDPTELDALPSAVTVPRSAPMSPAQPWQRQDLSSAVQTSSVAQIASISAPQTASTSVDQEIPPSPVLERPRRISAASSGGELISYFYPHSELADNEIPSLHGIYAVPNTDSRLYLHVFSSKRHPLHYNWYLFVDDKTKNTAVLVPLVAEDILLGNHVLPSLEAVDQHQLATEPSYVMEHGWLTQEFPNFRDLLQNIPAIRDLKIKINVHVLKETIKKDQDPLHVEHLRSISTTSIEPTPSSSCNWRYCRCCCSCFKCCCSQPPRRLDYTNPYGPRDSLTTDVAQIRAQELQRQIRIANATFTKAFQKKKVCCCTFQGTPVDFSKIVF